MYYYLGSSFFFFSDKFNWEVRSTKEFHAGENSPENRKPSSVNPQDGKHVLQRQYISQAEMGVTSPTRGNGSKVGKHTPQAGPWAASPAFGNKYTNSIFLHCG